MAGKLRELIDSLLTDAQREVLTAIERNAYIQGFVAAREPKNPADTLVECMAAEEAFKTWKAGG